jgi:hypothetical protein
MDRIGIALAFNQIAKVAGELIAVREAGFTADAFNFPRTEDGLIAICAFNGLPEGQEPPRGWRYYPNAGTKKAWERVIDRLRDNELQIWEF